MKTTLTIKGMHCTSCALSIDLDLEDLAGVKKAETNYAKSTTVIDYDDKQVSLPQILARIKKTGYEAAVK
jgi:copper chaperone CopZ